MKRLLQIAFTLILIIIISCNWNPLDPDNNDDDTDTTETWPDPVILQPHENLNMFPLNIGNSWTYKYYRWMSEGVFDTIIFTREIVYSKTINSKEYFMFNGSLPFFLPLVCPNDLIEIDYDSLFIRENEYGDILVLIDSLEYPYLIYNETYLDSLMLLPMPGINYCNKLKSINDTAITKIDTFSNCYKILNADMSASGTENYTWFAPEVGPVKIYYPSIGVVYRLIDKNIVSE